MSNDRLNIAVDDGKYRIIQHAAGGTVARRYEQDWLDVTNTPGSNMILAMAYELEELRAKVGKLTEEQYLLICLAEECAEVTQRVCKQLRFGRDEVQPGQELTNAERTAQESDDLRGVYLRLNQLGVLRVPDLTAVAAKGGKLDRYMAYSREQGTLA